jgi:hypothetical protein
VVLDVQASPLAEQHTQLLAQWLGPPTRQRLAPIEGDVIAFQASMRGGSLLAADNHYLFGALRDADPALALDPRAGLIPRLVTAQLNGLQGYLGAWPNPGLLQLLSGLIETPVDEAGYSRSLAGVSRRQFDRFTLLSFNPEVLAFVSPQLRFEEVQRPAQVWIRAEDLANSRLAPFINAYGYRQSRQIALGNARYMNMLVEQLHLPATEAASTAEQLLGAKMLDPLGGKYELRELPSGQKTWTSTSLVENPSDSPPKDYMFPALAWFRGIELELMTEGSMLALHGEVIMPVETKSSGFTLPGLPFGLSKPVGNNDKPKTDAKPSAKPKPASPGDLPKPSGRRDF